MGAATKQPGPLEWPGVDSLQHDAMGLMQSSNDARDDVEKLRRRVRELETENTLLRKAGPSRQGPEAVSESFFATLEKELLSTSPLQTRRATREAVADFIENYYNSARRHSYIKYQTPLECELSF